MLGMVKGCLRKISTHRFSLTENVVRPASSSDKVLDIQKVEPSNMSFDVPGKRSPHPVQNNVLMEKIGDTDKSITSRAPSKSSSKATIEKDMTPVEKILPTTTKPLTQEVINRISEDIDVRFEVLRGSQTAEITLRNKGSLPIERGQWSVHFCITTGIELGNLDHRLQGYVLLGKKSIKLTHLNGCAYKLEPTRDFKSILPGNSLKFMARIRPTLARSDLAPRWYVSAVGLEPKIIANTADESLDFVFLSNRRTPWDRSRFANNDVSDLGKAPLLVIPTPLEIDGLNESKKLVIDSEWVLCGEPGLEKEASFLAGKPVFCKYVKNRSSLRMAVANSSR